MPKVIDIKKFRKKLGSALGDNLERAINMLEKYGPPLSMDVATVLLHAIKKEKVNEVLEVLEKYHEDSLRFKHPDQLKFEGASNPKTQILFLSICRDILKLTPTEMKGDKKSIMKTISNIFKIIIAFILKSIRLSPVISGIVAVIVIFFFARSELICATIALLLGIISLILIALSKMDKEDGNEPEVF